MCTGPYKLGGWATGSPVKVVRNDAYWNAEVKPLVREIDIKGVPEEATLTAGLKTGEIDGAYPLALSSLEELRSSGKVKVYEGRSYMSDAMITANFNGVLGDARVRRALSMALDRDSLVETLYAGAAIPSRALSTPGQWGYARDAFSAAWNALPDTTVKVDAAKRLVEAAGATGKTLALVTSSELKSIDLQATAMSNAAKSIGLKVRLKSASAANYISYFIDAKLRKTVDAFFTVNLSNWADPGAFYPYIALPGGTQNYNNYDNPKVIALLERARATEDTDRRAALLIRAQRLIVDDMPWIPTVGPRTLMVLNSKLAGAVSSSTYLFAPWADHLGGME
jgi:peptide/nickel transport system substrate-binding protein